MNPFAVYFLTSAEPDGMGGKIIVDVAGYVFPYQHFRQIAGALSVRLQDNIWVPCSEFQKYEPLDFDAYDLRAVYFDSQAEAEAHLGRVTAQWARQEFEDIAA